MVHDSCRWRKYETDKMENGNANQEMLDISPAARGCNLAKIPPNQVIDDFGRGSSVESESE